jgi:hypothetical protein
MTVKQEDMEFVAFAVLIVPGSQHTAGVQHITRPILRTTHFFLLQFSKCELENGQISSEICLAIYFEHYWREVV